MHVFCSQKIEALPIAVKGSSAVPLRQSITQWEAVNVLAYRCANHLHQNTFEG